MSIRGPRSTGRDVKADGREASMHGHWKSDRPIVPQKQPNKLRGAEAVEERGLVKGNAGNAAMCRTQCRENMTSGLQRVREAARRNKKERFTSLLHHVTLELLKDCYQRMNPRAASGVDGVTWREYGQELERNVRDLLERVHRGAYRAKASRRVYIPKAGGKLRPLGIATVEDKLLQAAVSQVLQSIYEVDFIGFSYGFRPGKSPHSALDALYVGLMRKRVNWVLDADIRDFFGTIDHRILIQLLERRIGDKRIIRLVRQWLSCGVLEAGELQATESGTPQGNAISPLLANVYLHYAFDRWVHGWRSRWVKGDVVVVRYCDDCAPRRRRKEAAMAA